MLKYRLGYIKCSDDRGRWALFLGDSDLPMIFDLQEDVLVYIATQMNSISERLS